LVRWDRGFETERIAAFFSKKEKELHEKIGWMVDHQTPSGNTQQLNAFARKLETELSAIGGSPKVIPCNPRLVCCDFPPCNPGIALIFHHDTVWPMNSFPNQSKSLTKWVAPGIFDMKANLALVLLSLEYLKCYHPEKLQKFRWLSSPDEEILGNVSANELVKMAMECSVALVFEPPLPNGAVKSKRKGCVRLRVTFKGVNTHAGNHYAEGRSALAAAARFLMFAEALTNLEKGLTVNVGLLQGGTSVNTRPGFAEMEMDIRMWSHSDWEKVAKTLGEYQDKEGVLVSLTTLAEIPPMNADHNGWGYLEQACREAKLPFCHGQAGGASDGSRLAPYGVKVMDGLGTHGGGEHADGEHVDLRALEKYFIRNTLLMLKLSNAMEK